MGSPPVMGFRLWSYIVQVPQTDDCGQGGRGPGIETLYDVKDGYNDGRK